MLQSLNIIGFRKYDNLKIDGLGQVNFILGENNIGKTSILEAVFAWACGQNIFPFLNLPLARGRYSNIQNPYWVMEEILAAVYKRYELPLKMSFAGIDDGRSVVFKHTIFPSDLLTEYDSSYKNNENESTPKNNSLTVKDSQPFFVRHPNFSPSAIQVAHWEVVFEKNKQAFDIMIPQFQGAGIKPFRLAKFIDVLSHTAVAENVHMYASLKRANLLQEVIREIGQVFPEIKGFDMIPYPDGSQAPVCVIKKNGNILPLYAYGDGIQKWFYIFGTLAFYKNSIICIDEIDSGFHPKAQLEFCKSIIKTAIKNNVQLFVTTHNSEFMDNFLKLASRKRDLLDTIRVLTLKSETNQINLRNISIKEAAEARFNYNLELI